MRRRYVFLSACLAASGCLPAWSQALSVRFYPAPGVHAYAIDSVRGVQGVLLQNIAIRNEGSTPITLDSVTLAVKGPGTPTDSRLLEAADLAKSAARGKQMGDAGMIEQLDFQFGGTALLGPKPVFASSSTLAPGETLMLVQQFLSYRGKRPAVSVQVSGHDAGQQAVSAVASLPILGGTKNKYRFPLAGTWFIGAGPTAHSHHRWVVPQEFALDIARIGDGGLSYRGKGSRLADHFAYGAPVLAAADGIVRVARQDAPESVDDLRRPGEEQAAYLKRVGELQDKRMAQGGDVIIGNYVLIEHAQGESTVYAHLKTASVRVKVGDAVRAGQVIGLLGSSGNSTEPHLHFHVCDRPDALRCAGVPVSFENIELPYVDQLRDLQTGDIVVAK
jgi:murein DD-endopeptidase MepM/ murein hydrolase activator NlpD